MTFRFSLDWEDERKYTRGVLVTPTCYRRIAITVTENIVSEEDSLLESERLPPGAVRIVSIALVYEIYIYIC